MNTEENTPICDPHALQGGLWLFPRVLGQRVEGQRAVNLGISLKVPLGWRVSAGQFSSLPNNLLDTSQKPMHHLHSPD